jgi:hypothetical protein
MDVIAEMVIKNTRLFPLVNILNKTENVIFSKLSTYQMTGKKKVSNKKKRNKKRN